MTNKVFGSIILVGIMIITSPSQADDNGLMRTPAVKRAINNPAFSAKISTDADAAASAPIGSHVHRNFIRKYFAGKISLVRSLQEKFQELCIKGPGEGCGAASDLLRGSQINEGCIGGPGEGCGGGRTPPAKN